MRVALVLESPRLLRTARSISSTKRTVDTASLERHLRRVMRDTVETQFESLEDGMSAPSCVVHVPMSARMGEDRLMYVAVMFGCRATPSAIKRLQGVVTTEVMLSALFELDGGLTLNAAQKATKYAQNAVRAQTKIVAAYLAGLNSNPWESVISHFICHCTSRLYSHIHFQMYPL